MARLQSVDDELRGSGGLRGPSSASMSFAVVRSDIEVALELRDLGHLGSGHSRGRAINESGAVTGRSELEAPPFTVPPIHAFLYPDVAMHDLGTLPGGDFSQGYGINDAGRVAGFSNAGGTGLFEAVLFTSDSLAQLGALGGVGSVAWDINNPEMVTGYASTNTSSVHAFVWTPDTEMDDLGTLGGENSYGRAINNAGVIAGASQNAQGLGRAFRIAPGGPMQDLGTLPVARIHQDEAGSSAWGINDAGHVVGASDVTSSIGGLIPDGLTYRAFLWTDSSGMTELGHLGGGTSFALGINSSDHVVGTSTLSDNTSAAFLWTPSAGMIDLNSLLPASSAWHLWQAWDINDGGDITGYGSYQGTIRAFRLGFPRDLGPAPE